jgi:Methyltransferase domain
VPGDGTSSEQSRYQKIMRLLATFAVDPVKVSRSLPGLISQRHGTDQHYEVDEAWNEHLHSLLGAPWPCPDGQRLDELIAEIGTMLAAKGLGYGRYTYGCFSDADSALCHAVWCTVLHTQPEAVIETGVAHGVTSRIVLEALSRNDKGHLWSIDLPYPFDHRLHVQTGAAVPDACRARWSYLEGSSRQRLGPLVAEVGRVDVFIHDSLHTAKNTVFEMGLAASAMPPGGVMLIDDIRTHEGFTVFARRHPGYQTIICPSADRLGMFGIAVNTPST